MPLRRWLNVRDMSTGPAGPADLPRPTRGPPATRNPQPAAPRGQAAILCPPAGGTQGHMQSRHILKRRIRS